MKLTLFACGLVIVLLSKGALARSCIETATADKHSPVASAAPAPTPKPFSSSILRVVNSSADALASSAMQNRIAAAITSEVPSAAATVRAGHGTQLHHEAT